MAPVTVSHRHGPVDKLSFEQRLFVTIETQLFGRPLQRKPIFRLVRIMATRAFTAGHRGVQMILLHHVTTVLMTGKT